MKQIGRKPQDQESSSTQSTGQSRLELETMEGGNPHGQTEYDGTDKRRAGGHMKSVVSLGTSEFVFPPSQVGYGHSLACISYPYSDPYFGGFLAAYGSQATIHPQMVGMMPPRVPLPLDPAEGKPVYVNAKQYRGILRRRQRRAKLEAQNKLIKDRKPYLHESRHLHALKRVRGSGGRFLNTKKVQQLDASLTTSNGQNTADLGFLQMGGNQSESEVLQSETSNAAASTTSCSDITSVSNSDDIFLQRDRRFSGYPPHVGGTLRGGIMCNGTQHRAVIR